MQSISSHDMCAAPVSGFLLTCSAPFPLFVISLERGGLGEAMGAFVYVGTRSKEYSFNRFYHLWFGLVFFLFVFCILANTAGKEVNDLYHIFKYDSNNILLVLNMFYMYI